MVVRLNLILKFDNYFQGKWDGLKQRAEFRNAGKIPPKRGKNWKAKSIQLDLSQSKSDKIETDLDSDSKNENKLRIMTEFVDEKTNLISLLDQNFVVENSENSGNPEKSEKRFGIVGLHTCGNLAPDSMKIFLANPKVISFFQSQFFRALHYI